MVEVVRQTIEVLPANIEDTNRRLATEWLHDLFWIVRNWNENFISELKTYPGFRQSPDPAAYKTFFQKLASYERDLDERDETVKMELCRPLKHLFTRFKEEFEWLRKENTEAYDKLEYLVESAFRNEDGIIALAQDVVFDVVGHEAPDRDLPFETRITREAFLHWHAANFQTIVEVISAYDDNSREKVRQLRKISEEADTNFLRIREFPNPKRPGSVPEHNGIVIRTWTNRPQNDHALLYRILAFAFGVTITIALLLIAIAIPEPSSFQLRVFTTVLAISVAGCSTVMTGMLKVDWTFGSQLAVGAAGALATFVIVYLVNPAVL